jgi:DNA repair protein RecO (recombination protein O)
MALHTTRGIVLARRPLGEQDRLVEFFTRDHGRVRGVARSARRPRGRLTAALEPFTLGTLVFFDTGRSELVRVDHFDIIDAFGGLRDHLDRLGRAAWVLETVARLSAERDPQPPLFGLLARGLGALARRARPDRVFAIFALRAVDLLGVRPRIDRCVACGRPFPFSEPALDVFAGGLICEGCAAGAEAMAISGGAVGTLLRLRQLAWEEALRLRLTAELDRELTALAEGIVTRLIGQPVRAGRFLAQTRRGLAHVAEPSPPDR